MTGFGAAEGPVGSARVAVEVRSVNHRFFNPSIKLPQSLARWEPEVRETLRKAVNRGHVTLNAWAERNKDASAAIDETRFAAYVDRLKDLKKRYALDGEIDLATVLKMPDVINSSAEQDEGTAEQLVDIVNRAVAALAVSRDAEGKRLSGFLADRIGVVETAVSRLAARAPQRMTEHRDKLRASVAELANGVAVDEQRLAQEVAFLADRMDVGEELDRFNSHLTAFRDAMSTNGTEGVGKRLGFLLQELLREANTTGSKANDSDMTRDVIAIKEELERIREQVENLE